MHHLLPYFFSIFSFFIGYGRFFTNISEQDVQHLIEKSTAISLVDMWSTDDKLNRDGFYWVNVIIKKLEK